MDTKLLTAEIKKFFIFFFSGGARHIKGIPPQFKGK